MVFDNVLLSHYSPTFDANRATSNSIEKPGLLCKCRHPAESRDLLNLRPATALTLWRAKGLSINRYSQDLLCIYILFGCFPKIGRLPPKSSKITISSIWNNHGMFPKLKIPPFTNRGSLTHRSLVLAAARRAGRHPPRERQLGRPRLGRRRRGVAWAWRSALAPWELRRPGPKSRNITCFSHKIPKVSKMSYIYIYTCIIDIVNHCSWRIMKNWYLPLCAAK